MIRLRPLPPVRPFQPDEFRYRPACGPGSTARSLTTPSSTPAPSPTSPMSAPASRMAPCRARPRRPDHRSRPVVPPSDSRRRLGVPRRLAAESDGGTRPVRRLDLRPRREARPRSCVKRCCSASATVTTTLPSARRSARARGRHPTVPGGVGAHAGAARPTATSGSAPRCCGRCSSGWRLHQRPPEHADDAAASQQRQVEGEPRDLPGCETDHQVAPFPRRGSRDAGSA